MLYNESSINYHDKGKIMSKVKVVAGVLIAALMSACSSIGGNVASASVTPAYNAEVVVVQPVGIQTPNGVYYGKNVTMKFENGEYHTITAELELPVVVGTKVKVSQNKDGSFNIKRR
jgi:hypothetical protein